MTNTPTIRDVDELLVLLRESAHTRAVTYIKGEVAVCECADGDPAFPLARLPGSRTWELPATCSIRPTKPMVLATDLHGPLCLYGMDPTARPGFYRNTPKRLPSPAPTGEGTTDERRTACSHGGWGPNGAEQQGVDSTSIRFQLVGQERVILLGAPIQFPRFSSESTHLLWAAWVSIPAAARAPSNRMAPARSI
jgi:hypothetical protein